MMMTMRPPHVLTVCWWQTWWTLFSTLEHFCRNGSLLTLFNTLPPPCQSLWGKWLHAQSIWKAWESWPQVSCILGVMSSPIRTQTAGRTRAQTGDVIWESTACVPHLGVGDTHTHKRRSFKELKYSDYFRFDRLNTCLWSWCSFLILLYQRLYKKNQTWSLWHHQGATSSFLNCWQRGRTVTCSSFTDH